MNDQPTDVHMLEDEKWRGINFKVPSEPMDLKELVRRMGQWKIRQPVLYATQAHAEELLKALREFDQEQNKG